MATLISVWAWYSEEKIECCSENSPHICFWRLRKAAFLLLTAKHAFFPPEGSKPKGHDQVKSLCFMGTEELTVSFWSVIIYGQKRRWLRIPSLLLLQGDWTGWSLRVPSNPNYSMSLYTFRHIFLLLPGEQIFILNFIAVFCELEICCVFFPLRWYLLLGLA